MAISILSGFTPPAGVELRPELRNDIVTEQKASKGSSHVYFLITEKVLRKPDLLRIQSD